MFKISFGRIEEIARYTKVVGFTAGNLSDRIPVKAKENGTRVAQDNRRVSRDEKLRMSRDFEVVNDLKKR